LASGRSPLGAFLVDVRVDSKARRMVPPPWLVDRSMFSDVEMTRKWPWLVEADGDLGVFLDISGVKKASINLGSKMLVSTDERENFEIRHIHEVRWTGCSTCFKKTLITIG
jgi:hypothetical protein